MRIRPGVDGGLFVVFGSGLDAEKYSWLFVTILSRRVACYGGYENAYQIW